MNIFQLAWLELQREGVRPNNKNYGKLWEKKVYQISKFISKMDAKKKN